MRAVRRLRTAEAASSHSREHAPRRVAVEQRSRDRPVGDPRAGERAGDLGDAAGRAVRQPFGGRHRLVVERPRRLEIEDHDRRIDRLHGRQHLRRRRVGRGVEQDEIGSRCGEHLARLPSAPGACRRGRRRRPRAHPLEARLDPALIALEPLAQALELRPVGGEADPEDADPHCPSACAASARCLRPPRCAAARARAGTCRARSGRSRSRGGARRRRCSGPGRARGRRSARSGAAEHRDGKDDAEIVPRPPKIETPPSRTIVTT